MRRSERGFTLMELMVVIVIVAILAAVAVPLYLNYVKDAQRTEAKGAIGAIITAEQTYYQRPESNGQYTEDLSVLNVDLSDVSGQPQPRWTFSISNADANGFTVKAVGAGTNKGLTVSCIYKRGSAPTWSDVAP